MYRNDRWKLIVYHSIAQGELYDLTADPDEYDNLWNDETAKEVKYDLLRASFDASIRAIDVGPQLIGRY
ncbi:MAG: DUF4976 domain-containing protein [Spirochaetales bacterium]|jgi:arylsulfatase|nr:DUF4976 domain-containing protein [Spirochaetales bacterium]